MFKKCLVLGLSLLAATTSFGAFNVTDWQHITLTYSQFSDPGLTKTVLLTGYTLPAKQVLKDFLIKTNVPFVSSGGPTNVVWTSITNATASGNTITKNGTGVNGTWDAVGRSVDQVASGNTYVEFDVASGGTNVIGGLSHNAPTTAPTYSNIDYAWFVNPSNQAQVFESGGAVATYSYTYGQTLRVEFSGTDVLYKINGVLKYTHSAAVPQYPQFVVASMQSNNISQIHNAILNEGSATALLDFGNTIGGTTRYNTGYNLVPAASATNLNAQSPFASVQLDNMAASMDLEATVRSSAPLSSLTAGIVDIYFRTETLP